MDDYKKAFESAEKELKKKKIEEIKKIITATFEKLEEAEKERQTVVKRIQILKRDLDDLKTGRLDRIAERQKVDETAKKESVVVIKEVIVEKERIIDRPWYRPYDIYWNGTYNNNWTYCTTGGNSYSMVDTIKGSITTSANTCGAAVASNTALSMCGDDFSANVSGTYKLTDGTIKYI